MCGIYFHTAYLTMPTQKKRDWTNLAILEQINILNLIALTLYFQTCLA